MESHMQKKLETEMETPVEGWVQLDPVKGVIRVGLLHEWYVFMTAKMEIQIGK